MSLTSILSQLLIFILIIGCEDVDSSQPTRYEEQITAQDRSEITDAFIDRTRGDQAINTSSDMSQELADRNVSDYLAGDDLDADIAEDMEDLTDQNMTVPVNNASSALSINYANTYLLDNFQSRNPDYLDMHRLSIQDYPAFYGALGDRVLPDTGEANVVYEVFGLQAPTVGLVAVLQMAFNEVTNEPVNPFIQISLDTELIQAGVPYDISSEQRLSRLMVFNVNPDLSLHCVDSLGFGSVTINSAMGLSLTEGGEISLYGSNIPIFHPAVTPDGDLTSLLLDEGKLTCPFEDEDENELENEDLNQGDPLALVINEIDYASPGPDQGEFLEIYNPSASPIDLNDLTVEFIRGDQSIYQRVVLTDVGTVINPYSFIILGDEETLSRLPSNSMSFRLRDSIQNGSMGNGVRLSLGGIGFEEVAYGGFSLGEGSVLVADDDRRNGQTISIGRCTEDTDSNANDFVILNPPTPGNINECR